MYAFTFGIYCGGAAGAEDGLADGRPDDPSRVVEAVDALRGGRPFAVRAYFGFDGTSSTLDGAETAAGYAGDGKSLDVVLCCGAPEKLDLWEEFVRGAVRRFGGRLAKVQICEEPNLYRYPGDGRFFPAVMEALWRGLAAAKDEIRRGGWAAQTGFNAVPCFQADDRFWTAFPEAAPAAAREAIDYCGFDFFPDVFAPIGAGQLRQAVQRVLAHHREVTLRQAGIAAHVPMHICEHGWPTGPGRPPERQAEALETVIRAVYDCREELNITHYELFALRDADSANPDIFRQFGIMRDDYTPKPAFGTYRRLIAELSGR